MNLAIRWSDEPAKLLLSRLKRSKGVPVHGEPKHIKNGASVALVQRNGIVPFVFECQSIDGPMKVTLAKGNEKENGFIIRVKPGQLSGSAVCLRIKSKWRAVGQFLYFDDNWKRVDVTGHRGDRNYLEDGSVDAQEGLGFRPYTRGIPGRDRNDPEAVLVDQYIRWMRDPKRWGHRYLAA